MRAERIRERFDFAQCAKHPHANALRRELLIFEQNKEVALWRWDAPRHLQQIDGLRQPQFRKAANLEPADAEQETLRHSLIEKLDCEDFAAFAAGENKNGIRACGRIRAGQPLE